MPKLIYDYMGYPLTKDNIISDFREEFYFKYRVRPLKRSIKLVDMLNAVDCTIFTVAIIDTEDRGLVPKKYDFTLFHGLTYVDSIFYDLCVSVR